MTRGSLVGLIHSITLVGRDEGNDDGRIVTLMSNDVSNLEKSAGMFHETWAQVLEVVIGVVLLAKEVGWVWPLPLCIIARMISHYSSVLQRYTYWSIAVSSQVSRYVAKNLKPRQGKWNAATQDRISVTSSILGSIKTIKMTGLQDAVESHIQEARRREINVAGAVRWMMWAYGVSGKSFWAATASTNTHITCSKWRRLVHTGSDRDFICGDPRAERVKARYGDSFHHCRYSSYGHSPGQYGHDYRSEGYCFIL